MLAWSNLSIPNLFFCILLFCKFLMYFIVFISYVHCFYDFLLVIWSWLISRYKKLCKWPKTQNKHCFSAFWKSVISMCFVHKPMQQMFVPTCEHVTSRPTVRFSQTWYKRCARLERKKSWKACHDLRRSRGSRGFRAGGVKLTPPPPQLR